MNIYIIGCGGTGSHLIAPFCRTLLNENFDRLFLVDGDVYSEDNTSRQDFHHQFIGYNKAEAQAIIISKRFPSLDEKIVVVNSFLGPKNIATIITDDSIIFTCVDNNYARKIINNHALTLKNVKHICAGNEQQYGQVMIHVRKDGKNLNPDLSESLPNIAKAKATEDRAKMSCEKLAKLEGGGQTIAVNHMAASLMLSAYSSLKTFEPYNHVPMDGVEFDVIHWGIHPKNKRELTIK